MGELTVIRGASVFAPEELGRKDVLLGGRRVVAMASSLDVGSLDVVEVDGSEGILTPGLVDGHLHTIGGGGNEGYASRIPEVWSGELGMAGLTTVIAPPGLDMITKNLETILAKAYALEVDGFSAYMMVGGFQQPFATLTGSLVRDIFAFDRVIGVKVALGDTRASKFDDHDLLELAAQLNFLAGATGKACLLHAHLGGEGDPAHQLLLTMSRAGVPKDRYMATHCNYTSDTMAAAVEVAALGGYVDFNPVLDPSFGHPRSTPVAPAVVEAMDRGVPVDRLTMTTDGNASVPILLPDGSRDRYEKSLSWLWDAVGELVSHHDVPLPTALGFVTTNPARAFGLDRAKGRVRVGGDADLILADPEDMRIRDVWAGGRRVVAHGDPIAMSMFEHGRQPGTGRPDQGARQ